MGITAIVLAGDRRASHPVFGMNKALLPLEGRAVIAHVVRTLADVDVIGTVCVVGPVDRLTAALASVPERPGQVRRILPQGRSLYDNVWHTFLRLVTGEEQPNEAAAARVHGDALVAVIAGDIPLATPCEVEDFLARADMTAWDYVVGLTPIEALEPYAPTAARMGVRMAALNVAEGGFRQNNLHLIRPFHVHRKYYVEEFYEARYQKEWWNAAVLMAKVFSHGGTIRALTYLARMQLAMRAQARGQERVAHWARRSVPMADVCATVGRMLRTRFTALVCPFGGAALDIDNEHDLAAMAENFRVWRGRLLREVHAA